jgi:hypothetical protein
MSVSLGEAFQVCYVVADRDAGVRALGEHLGLGGWVEFEARLDVDAAHGSSTADVAVAFARWGRMVVEVVEPLGGEVGMFTDVVAADGSPRVHHLGVRVEDLATAREQASRWGAECVLSGHVEGQVEFAFMDARPQLGHHIELVQFTAQGWSLIAGILGDST